MNNLIRSEIYKIIRSRVFKNSCIIISLSSVLVMFFKLIFHGKGSWNLIHSSIRGREYGFTISGYRDTIPIEYLYNALGIMAVILIISIFIVGVSVINEYISGAIKNSIAYGHNRIIIYLSKMIGVSIVVMGITTVFILISIFGSSIIYGLCENFTFNMISEIIIIIIFVNIALICFVSINMCLAFMIRSKALILLVFMLNALLTLIRVAKSISSIMRFNPLFMLMDVCAKVPTMKLMVTYTVNCLVVIAVSTLVGAIFFKKQDIK